MPKDFDALEAQRVDPARLEPGHWCHRAEKTIGRGDIATSYSADRIGMDKPLRNPFSWQGALWVCVAIRCRNARVSAEAYRLVHPQNFDGQPVTYGQRVKNGDAARADPCGFYHGMIVRHGGADYVLFGPPVIFAPGLPEQLSLF